jgi:hypothetical protein
MGDGEGEQAGKDEHWPGHPNNVPLTIEVIGRPLKDLGSVQLPYRERTVSPGA